MMKKNVVLSIVCIFIIAPLGGWLTAYTQRPPSALNETSPAATNSEILSTLKQYNTLLSDSPKYDTPLSVESAKRMDAWWYVVAVKLDGGSSKSGSYVVPALLSKFPDDHSMRVVVAPGSIPFTNISYNLGVPYDVIDELNKVAGEYQ